MRAWRRPRTPAVRVRSSTTSPDTRTTPEPSFAPAGAGALAGAGSVSGGVTAGAVVPAAAVGAGTEGEVVAPRPASTLATRDSKATERDSSSAEITASGSATYAPRRSRPA